jgi:hypothetical protein
MDRCLDPRTAAAARAFRNVDGEDAAQEIGPHQLSTPQQATKGCAAGCGRRLLVAP